MKKEVINSTCPQNKEEWRLWLDKNHLIRDWVWLIIHKKSSDTPTITWSEAVDEALCFGWIDSIRKPIDAEKYMQYFGKRKVDITWSKINKNKVTHLIEQGLMSDAGVESIERAKLNGSWTILDEVEELKIPKDLEKALKLQIGSKAYFLSLSKSIRKAILQWVVLAKRPETREKRILEIANLAADRQKPKQFR
ncbi:MAG: YdeI/OmpD-associated family protein [Saprospiraceae bacterium]|nr:YdeI/OmpD-associated family protein [Saprospiraceae bacterium]